MARICSAPSEVRAVGAAGTGAAAFAGAAAERRERLREIRISPESSPENSRLKKARNANTIRFNSMAPSTQDSKVPVAPGGTDHRLAWSVKACLRTRVDRRHKTIVCPTTAEPLAASVPADGGRSRPTV